MKLSNKWIEQLMKLPESGMGYQNATVTLNNGSKYEDVKILNCSSIVSVADNVGSCPFVDGEIKKIDVVEG